MKGQLIEQMSRAELQDGTEIVLRRLQPGDADEVVGLYAALSDEECYFRFFTFHAAHLQEWALSLFDHSNGQYALGAFDSDVLIGVANYVVCAKLGQAEVAIVVLKTNTFAGWGRRYFDGLAKSRSAMVYNVSLPRYSPRTTPCFA